MSELFGQAAGTIIDADRAAAEATAGKALEAGISTGQIMSKGFVAGIAERFESCEPFLSDEPAASGPAHR